MMTLNISGKEDFVNPPPAAIGLAVDALVGRPDDFFVLGDGDLSYVQGQWCGEGFRVEHQRGDPDQHFVCAILLDATQVTGILRRYLAGETSWMQEHPWEHMILDDLPAPECVTFPLGEFDGPALKHVIREFEEQGIDYEAEPSGAGLSIFVAHGCSGRARSVLDRLFPQ